MSTTSQPLRTAIIGLSSSATTSWAAKAHLPGLVAEAGQSRFAIKALLNSSLGAARSAIDVYKLSTDTKAYGSPDALAADPDIDLVICNTRVDKHYETIIPSVRAGKDVFVEWPIAAKKEHIQELVETAMQSGSRVAVALQRRWNPVITKIRQLISHDETLGKVLSLEIRMFGGSIDREILPIGLKYFAQREMGGNPIVIGVGHALDAVLSVVGDLDIGTVQARTQLQRPRIRIRDPSTNRIIEELDSDVPDLLTFSARFQPSPRIARDATLAFYFRRGQPFPGTPSLSWTINFEHGEIRVVSPSATSMEVDDNDEPITAQVHRFEDNLVEDIMYEWSPRQAELPLMARSVSETLYAFADHRQAGDGWVSLEDAARRADLMEKLLNA